MSKSCFCLGINNQVSSSLLGHQNIYNTFSFGIFLTAFGLRCLLSFATILRGLFTISSSQLISDRVKLLFVKELASTHTQEPFQTSFIQTGIHTYHHKLQKPKRNETHTSKESTWSKSHTTYISILTIKFFLGSAIKCPTYLIMAVY